MGFRGCAAGGFGAFLVRLGRRVATWSRVLGCVVGATLSSRFRRVLCGPPTPRACFGGALAGFLVGICTRTTRPLLIYCIVVLCCTSRLLRVLSARPHIVLARPSCASASSPAIARSATAAAAALVSP